MTFDTSKMIQMAKALFAEERRIDRLDGWFLAKEIEMLASGKYEGLDKEIKKAGARRDRAPFFVPKPKEAARPARGTGVMQRKAI